MIAWLNPRDHDHARVTAYLQGFTGRLVTTEWVLIELADAMSAPACRSAVGAFLHAVRADPLFEVVGYEWPLYEAGFNLVSSRPDKEWSLTDCISFIVMGQRRLLDALTSDHHFEQAGFRAVFRSR